MTVHLYLSGSTAALNEHTNYWTELRAIIMPDCTSHTTNQGWNNYCIVVSASGEIEINPVSWKVLFWTGIICTYSSSGMVLVSKDWNHLLYNKGAIDLHLLLCVPCDVSPYVLILLVKAWLRVIVAVLMQLLHLRWLMAESLQSLCKHPQTFR